MKDPIMYAQLGTTLAHIFERSRAPQQWSKIASIKRSRDADACAGDSEQALDEAVRDSKGQQSGASHAHHAQAETAELQAQQQQATCDALLVRQLQAQLKRLEAEAAQAEERAKDLLRSKADLHQDVQRLIVQICATEARAREREQELSDKLNVRTSALYNVLHVVPARLPRTTRCRTPDAESAAERTAACLTAGVSERGGTRAARRRGRRSRR